VGFVKPAQQPLHARQADPVLGHQGCLRHPGLSIIDQMAPSRIVQPIRQRPPTPAYARQGRAWLVFDLEIPDRLSQFIHF
jgi:hypothetical protein